METVPHYLSVCHSLTVSLTAFRPCQVHSKARSQSATGLVATIQIIQHPLPSWWTRWTRLTHLDETAARDELPVVLPHNKLGGWDDFFQMLVLNVFKSFEDYIWGRLFRTDLRRYNSLANNTLELEGAPFSHVNIWPAKYPDLQDYNNSNLANSKYRWKYKMKILHIFETGYLWHHSKG